MYTTSLSHPIVACAVLEFSRSYLKKAVRITQNILTDIQLSYFSHTLESRFFPLTQMRVDDGKFCDGKMFHLE